MKEFEKFYRTIEAIKALEKQTLAGSFEHSEYLKAALFAAWPTIRAYAEITAHLTGTANQVHMGTIK